MNLKKLELYLKKWRDKSATVLKELKTANYSLCLHPRTARQMSKLVIGANKELIIITKEPRTHYFYAYSMYAGLNLPASSNFYCNEPERRSQIQWQVFSFFNLYWENRRRVSFWKAGDICLDIGLTICWNITHRKTTYKFHSMN